MLQRQPLSVDDFGGPEGCLEILNITRPDVVASIHEAYLAAGADLIETNTFGANVTALAEHGLDDLLEELAEAGADIARKQADAASTPDRPRWVLGSVGPGTLLPTLGQVSSAVIEASAQRQIGAMLRGGIDAALIETGVDLLSLVASVIGARRAIGNADIPLLVSLSTQPDGRMPLGDDLAEAVTTLTRLGITAIGVNCANGLVGLHETMEDLTRLSPIPLLCLPSAGLPTMTDDGPQYPVGPAEFAQTLAGFIDDFPVMLIGGCCGTTPEYIAALAERLG